jgi:peptidoglycan/LPS O-acetylase OafA/YrhL
MFLLGALGIVLLFLSKPNLPAHFPIQWLGVALYGATIFGAARLNNSSGVFRWPILLLLGEASYSLYIVHLPLHLWWNSLTRPLHLTVLVDNLCFIGIVIGVSVVAYILFEVPSRRRILGHREHRAA